MSQVRGLLAVAGLLCLAAPAGAASPKPGPQPDGQVEKPTRSPAASQTELSGCLAKRTAAVKRRAPAPRAAGSAIVVEHGLRHACCLAGKVETKVGGNSVEVVEHLRGTPCRCMCQSTLRTRIPLAPGVYRLTVWLDNRGTRERITADRLEVTVAAGQSQLVSLGEAGQQAKAAPSRGAAPVNRDEW